MVVSSFRPVISVGYWQTEIDERDRDKTAFVTSKGQW